MKRRKFKPSALMNFSDEGESFKKFIIFRSPRGGTCERERERGPRLRKEKIRAAASCQVVNKQLYCP